MKVTPATIALMLPQPPPFGGPGGGPPGGGMFGQERKVLGQFDQDKDGKLTSKERQAAREFLKKERENGGGFGGPRGGFGRRGNAEPPRPGKKITPTEVKDYGNAPLYDPSVLRTLFLTFENADWEAELADFRDTDVEVPADLLVDGKRYAGAGVHFRGASSYFMVSAGYKRSLNVSVDFTDKKQRLGGYKTLNLLNSNGDPTFLRGVLYSHIARQYLPAPKVNLVRVVINGENWGVYANQEQFDKNFLTANFPAKDAAEGVRWKVPGNPRGGGGLRYMGEDVSAYTRLYEIKTENKKQAEEGWKALIDLCRTLEKTPPEQLERALEPLLDVEGALKFLALENMLINEDGYWTRASDFNIYRDPKGKFYILPHDMNEAFKPMGGPGGPGGPRGRGGFGGPPPGGPPPDGGFGGPPPPNGGFGGPPPGGGGFGQPPGGGGFGRGGGSGVELDPLVAANDVTKPLLSKLLAVPSLRRRYLTHMKNMTETWLDWNKLQPIVTRYQTLIAPEVAIDTRKLESLEAFQQGLGTATNSGGASGGEGGRSLSLRAFIEQRRKYLLSHPILKDLPR
jgi:hypothetical protein